MRINHGLRAAATGGGGVTTDPNFRNTVLLLNGDGTNGAQNNTFIDSSTNNFTITRNGNVTQGSFSPYGDRWSAYFDGTGDSLSAAANTSLDFGTGDFTIEFWIYFNSIGSFTGILDIRNGVTAAAQGLIYLSGTSLIYYASGAIRITGSTMTSGTWRHVAVCRGSGTTRLFVDGTQSGSSFSDSINYIANPVILGAFSDSSIDRLTGYISNLRILKGTALYTSNFTPPTSPLTAITNTSLLACHANRFVDGSSNNFTITRNGDTRIERFSPFAPSAAYSTSVIGGSAYFDGSGDYLTVPSDTALAFGTGDFTVECWVYRASTATAAIIDYALLGGFGFYITSTQIVSFISQSTAYTATATVPLSAWAHIAFSRSGTTLKTYLNGAEVGSFTVSYNFISPSAFTLGRNAGSGADQFNGYISNLRVLKGTALYTSNFTPPTAPLTAVTNTSLLLNAVNGGIVDATAGNVLETAGTVALSTTQAKYGTASISFNAASGSALAMPSNLILNTIGDFTVEGWLYPTASDNRRFFAIRPGGNSTAMLSVRLTFGNLLQLFVISSAGNIDSGGVGPITLNQWSHVACTRFGGSITLYLNGTSVYTSTTIPATATLTPQGNGTIIGAANDFGYSQRYAGFMDDIRITKGVARYTANFTPPTAALPLL